MPTPPSTGLQNSRAVTYDICERWHHSTVVTQDQKAVTGNVEALQSPLSTYVLRLSPGAEIFSSLQRLVEEKQLEAAFIVTCVGSVTKARLRMANSVTINTYEGHFEIVSLVGTLSAGGHVHGSFSDKDGKVFGGHVMGDLIVYTTAEIVVGNCPLLRFKREHDDQSGYPELVVEKKSTEN